jgi:hypothetical protein
MRRRRCKSTIALLVQWSEHNEPRSMWARYCMGISIGMPIDEYSRFSVGSSKDVIVEDINKIALRMRCIIRPTAYKPMPPLP